MFLPFTLVGKPPERVLIARFILLSWLHVWARKSSPWRQAASTWKLPRCFCPIHFNISLDLEISREGGGEESLTASLGQLPRANPSAGAGRGGRQGEVETPRQRGVMRTMDPDRSPGPWAQLVLETTLGLCWASSHRGAYDWTSEPRSTEPRSGSQTVKRLRLQVQDRRRLCTVGLEGLLMRRWSRDRAGSPGEAHSFQGSSGPWQEASLCPLYSVV